MNYLKQIIILTTILLPILAFTQVSDLSIPPSFLLNEAALYNTYELPNLDNEAEQQRADLLNAECEDCIGSSYYVSGIEEKFDVKELAKLTILEDGSKVYKLKIT
jgi:hypothetical protein